MYKFKDRTISTLAMVTIVIVAMLVVFFTLVVIAFDEEPIAKVTTDEEPITSDPTVIIVDPPITDETTEPPPTEDPGDIEPTEDPITIEYPHVTNNTVDVYYDLDCWYGLLVDAETMEIIAQKSMTQPIFPASMTKVMTVLVAYQNISDLDATFTMTNDIINPLIEANASRAGFVAGETITIRDLFYGAVLPSGADCTVALAKIVAGSEYAFVAKMNEMCKTLELKKTHFTNTSGLQNDDHYSTVSDLAVIMKAAMDIPFLKQLLSADSYTSMSTSYHPDGITFYSTSFSKMGFNHSAGSCTIIGAKTGWTGSSKYCIMTYATDSIGKSYICVTAKGTSYDLVVNDNKYLYSTYVK